MSAKSQRGGDGVVILSPHFDDAVLSCWSVLTGPAEVEVLNVFTGPPARPTDLSEAELLTGADDALVRARERADEDRAALAVAGVQARNVGLLDHPHWAAGRRLARWRTGHRLRELREAIETHLDRRARLYVPAALGGHPDHVLIRELGCGLLRDGASVSFYADQPYCYAYGWPHWVIGAERDPNLDLEREWRRHLDTASVNFGELRAEVVRLGAAHERKLEALRVYRSQFAVLEGGANRRVSNRELTGLEVFWHS